MSRFSYGPAQPRPKRGNRLPPLMSEQSVAVINGIGCPKCGVPRMHQCVYTQVPMPRSRDEQSPAWVRYEKSGSATKVPHIERREAYRALQVKEARTRKSREWREQQKKIRAQRPPDSLLAAAHAMRQFDLREHERLREWIAAYGEILVNANQEVSGS